MIWFTSDLHFGHANILQFTDRPFDTVGEMNAALVRNWNASIRPTDIVYVLGDLALCSYKDFVPIAQQLNGIKYLIKGNHDKYSDGQYNRLGFTVFHELKLKLFGHTLRLSHYPYAYPWYKRLFAFRSELRFMERRPPRIPGETLLHGHTHTKYRLTADGRIHVGVDAWDMKPVSSREIEALLAKRRPS